jgi:hypothetical protein
MCLVDENIRKGLTNPYDWQKEFHRTVEEADATASDKDPWCYTVTAGNGAGKDSYIIAWLAVWFIVSKVRSRVIITSGSVNQVNTQTEPYIREVANKVNKWFEKKSGQPRAIVAYQKHYVRCLQSGSEIRLFATDDAGKAEGYHPMPYPDTKMLMIVNEAKSVAEEIFTALHRCTGYSHWLEISSPGEPRGHFYESTKRYPGIVVDYTMCPHISEKQRLRDADTHGVSSIFYRSCYLGLFTLVSEKSVVDMVYIEKCRVVKVKHKLMGVFSLGGDVAGGKDKNAVTVFNGNKFIALHRWRERDMAKTSSQFIKIFLNYPGASVAMDCNAIGQPIVDTIRADARIQEAGITIIGIRNQGKAINQNAYGNRGAEIWTKGNRLIEQCKIICDFSDAQLVDQLTKRRFTDPDGIKLYLESKSDHPGESPDEADSFMLALSRIPDLSEEETVKEKEFDPRDIFNKRYNFDIQPTTLDTRELIQHERFSSIESGYSYAD